MKSNFFRGTLAATCAVTILGAVAFAGPASAVPEGDGRVFTYHNAQGAQTVTLEQMCNYYTNRAAYDNIVATQPLVFQTLQSENNMTVIAGTDGPDTISKGSGSQMILAFGGSDRIATGSGSDYVCGDSGSDVIDVGSGDDEVIASMGDDTVSTGSGDDRIRGGKGADTLSGGSDDDWIDGGFDTATDNCSGGSGNDEIVNCP